MSVKADTNKNSILHKQLKNTPEIRLKSRKSSWTKIRKLIQSHFCSVKEWQKEMLSSVILEKELIKDPTQKVNGFEFPR